MGGTSKIRQAGALMRRTFDDVDDMGRAGGFDIRFRQLTDGTQRIPGRLRLGRQVTLMTMRFNCGFHQRGVPPAGKLNFGVPVTGMRDWCARPYATGDWLNFNNRAGLDGVSEAGFVGVTVSVSLDLMERAATRLGIAVPAGLLRPPSGAVVKASPKTRYLDGLVQRLLNDESIWMDQDCETAIAAGLIDAATGAADDIAAAPAARRQAVAKALGYLEAHADEAVSVSGLCTETGVAWRTLNRAFRERFGVGPKAYINRERLLRVRSTFLRAPPDTIIADVANASGFWHMGQFARDYRRMFGELPSDTLRS